LINRVGTYVLFEKEVWRFLKVAIQTILAPVVTVILYLLVFSSVISSRVEVYQGVTYTAFLIPGLIIMSVIQNAFANTSSSVFQSKINGSIIFMLLAPLADIEIYMAFIGAAIVRGVAVGIGVWAVSCCFEVILAHNIWILLFFSVIGSGILGALGLIASIWADKWDHISAFQNFVILPLSFLSGVFFSINSLPEFWSSLSHYNPFFYMIDGFRYGFLGVSEVSHWQSMAVVSISFAFVSFVCLYILHIGYKIRG